MSVKEVIEQIKVLNAEELDELLGVIIRLRVQQSLPEDNSPWTDEELAELMTIEPLTGAEIIQQGLAGGWADLEITEGATWIDEQRLKRLERKKIGNHL